MKYCLTEQAKNDIEHTFIPMIYVILTVFMVGDMFVSTILLIDLLAYHRYPLSSLEYYFYIGLIGDTTLIIYWLLRVKRWTQNSFVKC